MITVAISEYYQRLSPWLIEPINRTHRLYLETHLELLSDEYEHFLTLLIGEYDDHPEEQQRLRVRHELLRDIRMSGISIPSIRHAYVNRFGGLLLDMPAQLIEIEQQLAVISHIGWTDRVVAVCKTRLLDAIACAKEEWGVAPETVAELHYCLGSLFIQTSLYASTSLRERVLGYYEIALQTYTVAHYPLQHAKVSLAIGNAYLCCPLEKKRQNLEHALPYYKIAAHIYDQYATLLQTFA
ncbi:MAG: hypothetical protein NVS4B11_08220 [Ktedonobacteraceae bacterium]